MANVTSEKYCTIYLVPDGVMYTLCCFGTLITIATFLSNLTMLFYLQKIKHKTGGFIFYQSIIYISMFSSLVGQPLEMANALMKTSNLIVNLCSNACLFLLFSATYHCIAGLTFERYIAIKGEGAKKEKEKRLLAVTIAILVVVTSIPKFYNISQIIIKRHNCEKVPDSWVTIATMCTWLTYCSFSIYVLTKKAIQFVKDYDRVRKDTLGKTQATNIKRLKVTKKIWLVFSALWLPYGTVNMLQQVFKPETYELLNAVARGFTSGSFAVLPVVYYFMDKNYAAYVEKRLEPIMKYSPSCIRCRMAVSKNKVTDSSMVDTPTQPPNMFSKNVKIIKVAPITETSTYNNT